MRFSVQQIPCCYGVASLFLVSWYGFGLILTTLLAASVFLSYWIVSFLSFGKRSKNNLIAVKSGAKHMPITFESIPPSHYCEKIRWVLDKLDVAYTEEQDAGILGILFVGRSVPVLRIDDSNVRIGNSREIMQFLYGFSSVVSADGDPAEWLRPTKERMSWEIKLDSFGRCIQVWGYHILLNHKDLCFKFWGLFQEKRVPLWQRKLMKLLFPVVGPFLRSGLKINEKGFEIAREKITATLDELEKTLSDGRLYLCGDELTYVDITCASLCVFLVDADEAPAFGGNTLEPKSKVSEVELPENLRKDKIMFMETHPKVHDYIRRVWAERPGK